MENDPREGVLRGARQSSNVAPSEDKNMRGDRAEHVGRGTYINYYDDLQFSTTEQKATKVRGEEKAFQEQVAAQQSSIDSSRSNVESSYASAKSKIQEGYSTIGTASSQLQQQASTAKSQLSSAVPSLSSAISSAWAETKKTFIPVRVVNGNTVEATYMLPASTAENLAAQEGVASGWVEDNGYKFYNVDVRTKEGGRIIGAELHKAFSDASNSLYDTWYDEAVPQIKSQLAKAYGEVATATSSLNNQISTAQSEIDSATSSLNSSYTELEGQYANSMFQISEAQGQLDSAKAKRQAMWDALRSDYRAQQATIESIFTNMSVGESQA